ncbi:MAG: nucleotidyltransferase domain-containing protein [Anaerolineaceae bacterium]|nr:nucleotidyltransferase domain-containing protein [Anaerolineaceae bacterium]
MKQKLGNLPIEEISEFCHRWHIIRMELFGSVLREDFTTQSDIDILVEYNPEYHRTLADQIQMHEEIENLFGRPVDLINRRSIERSRNYIRREGILGTAKEIYAKR